MKRPGMFFAAAGLALALGAAACSSGGAPSSPSGSGSSSPAGPVNRTFTYDTTAPVMDDGWDPATEYSDAIIAMSNMYETLTRYDPATHKVGPLLATSWSSSKNGLTWTFHLRQGVKFHTGRPLTAQAAKAAIDRTIKLAGGAAYVWDAVKSISTPDTGTLVFHLKYPSPLDLEASADYSAYIYDTKAAGGGSLAKWFNTPHDAGTGPYTVQTWNKGQEFEVTQTQFPGYWGGWTGSHFTKVVYRVVPQDTTSVQLLRSGQVSFVEQMAPALWESLRGAPGISLVSAASWQNLLGQLNAKTLSLPQRQAILYGINYDGIVAALKGAATLPSGLVPDGLFGHFGSTSLPNYKYDPAQAKQMIKQAGAAGQTVIMATSPTYSATIVQAIQADIQAVGLNVKIQSTDQATYLQKVQSPSHNWGSIRFGQWSCSCLDADGVAYPLFHTGTIWSSYSNPAFDQLVEKARETLAPATRDSLYAQAYGILAKDVPGIGLFQIDAIYGASTKLQWKPDAQQDFFVADMKLSS